jgi:hypothetical protein
MFERCIKWLGEMQEDIWEGREWGRTANYIVPPEGAETEPPDEEMDDINSPVVATPAGNGLDIFQWP